MLILTSDIFGIELETLVFRFCVNVTLTGL